MKQLICKNCSKVFIRKRLNKINNFCSFVCYTNWRKGQKFTEEHKRKIALAKIGNKNPMWKGEEIGKVSLHEWIRYRKPKPQFCECCNKVQPFDLANISGKYKRDINDFEWLCRKCHMTKDGRYGKFIEYIKKTKEEGKMVFLESLKRPRDEFGRFERNWEGRDGS